MATTNTYLNFNGNCEEAFTFYKSVFGGEFTHLGKFGEMPESDDYKVLEKDKNKVMHVSLPIGKSILMGSDIMEEYGQSFVKGDNFSIAITAENKEEANRIFTDLTVDGKITMPMNDTFWGDYFGMLIDKFGINWMVSYNENQQQ